jgi:hypothetical protein
MVKLFTKAPEMKLEMTERRDFHKGEFTGLHDWFHKRYEGAKEHQDKQYLATTKKKFVL